MPTGGLLGLPFAPLEFVPENERGTLFPLNHMDRLFWIIVFALCWSLLFIIVNAILSLEQFKPFSHDARKVKDSSFRHQLSSEIVSGIHSLLVTLGVVVLHSETTGLSSLRDSNDLYWAHDRYSSSMLVLISSYLLYDLFYELLFSQKFVFVIHHVVSFLTFGYCALRPFFQVSAVRFMIYEASTPFMNFRKLLLAYNKQDSILFSATNLAFLVTFFLARLLFGFYFSFRTIAPFLFENDIHKIPAIAGWFFTISNLILNLLNTHWAASIARFAFNSRKPIKHE